MPHPLRPAFALCLCLLGAALAQAGAAPEVVSFTLINADTNEAIGELQDGMRLDFGALGTRNLSVTADTRPARVGSVVFSLNDEPRLQLENVAPYAIAGDGDDGTDFYPWTPPLGDNVLTATPYTEANAGGEAGRALTVRFTVTEGAPAAAPPPAAEPAAAPAAPQPAAPPSSAPPTPAPATPAPPPAATAPAVTAPTPAPTPTVPPAPGGRLRSSFPVTALGGSGLRGSVMVSDYGGGRAIVNVFVNRTAAGERYPVRLHVGACGSGGGALAPLQSVRGESGMSTTHTGLFYEGLVQGAFHINIYRPDETTDETTVLACAGVGTGAN